MSLRALTVAIGSALGIVASGAGVAHGEAVPFQDPAANGLITLCDVNGHVATHGSIYTKPFVWRAVGSTAGVGSYRRPGRTATIFGYQPIRDVDADLWQGEQLTGGATYTNAARPMAAATAADLSLHDLLLNYPPKWAGFIQVRMFLGGPGAAVQTAVYNAATIKVTGTSWALVQGGSSGCDSGTARSSEMIVPSIRALGTPAPNATTDVPTKPGHLATSGSSASASAAAVEASPSADGASAAGVHQQVASADSSASTGSPSWPWLLGAAALAGVVAFGWWRRRPTGGAG